MSIRCRLGACGLAALTLVALAAIPTPTRALQGAEGRSEVLVLGSYHMNNPGRDLFNTEADDVLSAHRQQDVAEVVEVLTRFRPTQVAVEADFSSDRTAEQYAAYLAGEHELSRSESQQLGFRVAAEMGLETVHAVDVEAEFPFPRLDKYMTATGNRAILDSMMEQAAVETEAQGAYLASHTILETLLHMNADEHIRASVGVYFGLAEFGEPWDWAGADLVAAWFQRNMRIYTNIVGLVDSPEERVLVIYGSGHLGWLQLAFEGNPRFRLRKLAELLP